MCTTMFIAALIIIVKTWKQRKHQLMTDERMKKLWYVCIYTLEYYLALKKEILSFMTTWMNLENSMLIEISQTQKYKYCMISHVESKRIKLTATESRKGITRGWKVGEIGKCWLKDANLQL